MTHTPSEKETEDLASVHTNGFTEVLKHFGISLAISTYQAGRLIIAREENGTTNTHFRQFNKPMGMVASKDRLTLGTAAQIWDFRNVSAAAVKLEPEGKHDACYLVRDVKTTGDIDIHEMTWVGEELWFINTRFSCLCTFEQGYSFKPQWRPPFITEYDMRDRCHLNGLATRDGKPRYITALGETNEAGGWRKKKANGGILMDIETNEFLLRGLSMPHSPRWHQEKLWFLESGCGTLNYLDPKTGKNIVVSELPGFTRGLDFIGDYAVIGLSQVRETAVFAGLPLTKTQAVRHSGLWIVDTRNGETKAFLKFEAGVQEIFAVSVLPWKFPDVINDDMTLMGSTYVLSDEVLKNVVQPDEDWTFAETHFEKGNQLYNDGDVEESIIEYKKCLAMMPDYIPALFNYGVAQGKLEQFEEALKTLNKVVKADAGHAEALNSMGYISHQLGHLKDAKNYFERAIAIRPEYTQAIENLKLLKP